MIGIAIENLGPLKASLQALTGRFKETIAARMQALSDDLVNRVKDQKLSGQALREVTGRLKESIAGQVSEDGGGLLQASVGVEGDVPYAAIQESGGSTKAHVIMATQGKALAFLLQGKQAFFAQVNHPGSQIPAHGFLSSALADSEDAILAGLSDAAAEALGG